MRVHPAKLTAQLARAVQAKLTARYEAVGEPVPGSDLDQVGLRDGQAIVDDYIRHGEVVVAAEHLLYMAFESGILLTPEERRSLESLCRALNLSIDGYLPREGDTR